MISATLPKRGTDDWGSGEFGASRGDHKHRGIDSACYPGTKIGSVADGEVTKIGYCYNDDLLYRYVQVTDWHSKQHRILYIYPSVTKGQMVNKGDIIGTAQDIAKRYTRPDKIMKNHIHYEILVDGQPENPELC